MKILKRKTAGSVFAALLLSSASYGQTTSTIVGDTLLTINSKANYAVENTEDVVKYEWLAPRGSRIVAGQGTASIELETTFLSQDGMLQLQRTLQDGSVVTTELPITLHRFIASFQDHTINPGDTFVLNGNAYTEADIYYEPIDGDSKFEQVIAHRVTLRQRTGTYLEMTKPYLQTATANSIYINWKTNFANEPIVRYGKSEDNLDQVQSGTSNALSATYYWHSVQLTGLEANTAYYYQVESEGKKSEVYRFRTQPEIGSRNAMRILLMGDHQLKSRSGYEWLMKAADRKIKEKYAGALEDNINLIMNVGDQVDVGTLDHYEHVHLIKTELMSPNLPHMTAVGNHELYQDANLVRYAAHFHYEDLEYQGVTSGTENYYAYQVGRILFVVLSTEHTGNTQKEWVRKVVDAAKVDDTVDFIVSVNHRPIQAEQYIGDISAWAREEIMPILSETPKHVFNYGGHHHLYHRGQLTDYPLYHIINGAASWDQMWGMSSEQDFDDVQKTIDYWGYQILEFDFDKLEMKAECYAIGNKKLTVDNILIDSFQRTLGKAAPGKPELKEVDNLIQLPYTFEGGDYVATTDEPLNTTQFQISLNADFSTLEYNSVRDFENLYGSTGDELHIPVDLHENVDITKLTIEEDRLKNGSYYIRARYRDANMEWSEWSDSKQFTVEGSIDGDPAIAITENVIAQNGQIVINYEHAPVGKNAWIGVYRKGDKPGTGSGTVTSYRWAYTTGASGSVSFTIPNVNEYFAVLFADGGYTEAAPRTSFYAGPTPLLSTDKLVYEEGDTVKVTFENGPALTNDWIGIYRMGHTPSNENSSSWSYVGAENTSGELSLGQSLGKGYYYVTYLLRDGYFEPAERQYFSIGEQISSVAMDKTEYFIDEEINVYYNDGPGTPKDWVGVYTQGEIVDEDELDAFYYTYGETDGYITIMPGDLPAGEYFTSLFINDSYDEVSNRVDFVIKEVTNDIDDQQKVPVRVYPNPVVDYAVVNAEEAQRVRVFSATGQCVQEVELQNGQARVDLSRVSKGVYFFHIVGEKGEKNVVNIIKK